MSLKKNDYAQIEITGITAENSGVGRFQGMAIFVPDTAIGDVVKVKIIKTSKSYCIGKIEKIITPSPNRINTDCPQSIQCGGCSFRHMTYEEECNVKHQRVIDALQRIAGIEIEVAPIVKADNPDRYRNKAQLPIGKNANGKMELGFFAKRSHRLIHFSDCLLQPEVFGKVIEAFKEWQSITKDEPYMESAHKGRLRHLYIRYSQSTGDVMVCIVVNGGGVHKEDLLVECLRSKVSQLKSVVININREKTNVIMGPKTRTIWGDDYITDELCGLKFNISPLSFYQVNPSQTEQLYSIAKEFAQLDSSQTVLDLYCGTGTIGLSMADSAKKIIGVEIIPQAIENAKTNAEINNIENAEFICADASEAAKKFVQDNIHADVVILDPPRKGCSEHVINHLAYNIRPDRIVYVSCDPATLARDIKLFNEKGYSPEKVTPVDMFPRTGHVETVCLLSKLHADQHIEVELKMDEMDLTAAESKATYEEIKAYVKEQAGLQVSNLYIAQVKQKCDIIERVNYNLPKSENSRQPKCPPEKEAAIREALEHFHMI